MADKRVYAKYRYKVECVYLNIVKGINTPITNECLKYMVIDHDYDKNSMPIIYASFNIDRALMDDMILNVNTNLLLVAIYKYDEMTDTQEPIEVIRDKFTYFIPNDVNKTMDMDYQDQTIDEHLGNTFQNVTLGLMSIRLINLNKRMIELNVTNNNIYDCAKYFLAEHENVVIEPFIFSDVLPRVLVPPQPSINAALKYLNSYKVFYYTPYRFYQDFNTTYLISSSGTAIAKPDELYSSTIINIRDVLAKDANDEGIVMNKTAKVFEIPVSYINTVVYDNTIANKSQNKLIGITSSGSRERPLINTASYASQDKYAIARLNNDNEDMLYNIKADIDSRNVFVAITKNDLDMDILSINKRITIHHIDRYQDFNGDYLLARKREMLLRENDTFVLMTLANFRKLERDVSVDNIPVTFTN